MPNFEILDDVVTKVKTLWEKALKGKEVSALVVIGSVNTGLLEHFKPIAEKILYADLPGLRQPGAEGHTGALCLVEINSKLVIIAQGRYHGYETPAHKLDFTEQVFLPYLLYCLGGEEKNELDFIQTAAVGAVDEELEPGQLVVVSGCINFDVPGNPLAGFEAFERGVVKRHPSMDDFMSAKRRDTLRSVLSDLSLGYFHQGVYSQYYGPNYETDVDVLEAKRRGANVVGMSVFAAAKFAKAAGLTNSALALVSNPAQQPGVTIDHERDVRPKVEEAAPILTAALVEYLKRITS